jgi:16S rRNA processing protein RimM
METEPVTRSTSASSGLTAVAKILTTVGLKGDLKVELYCSGPERLKKLRSVSIGPHAGSTDVHRFEDIRVQTNGIMVRLSGVADRTSAERLRGHYIFVADAEAEEPAPGAVRIDDLIGYSVVDPEGRQRGVISEVYSLAAYDLWSVQTGTKDVLVPAVAAWIAGVDRAHRRVVLASTEGLFDE